MTMSTCSRKLPHKCRYNPDSRLIIYARDYSKYGSLIKLNSTINDVTLVWKYFRRSHCFNEDQITVLGDIDCDGKMIPWKHRYNTPITKGNNYYFYYTGHGYRDGTLDIDICVPKNSFKIVDSCYSYLWKDLDKDFPYITSASEGNALSTSNGRISRFTFEVIKFLKSNPKYKDLIDWALENRYTINLDKDAYGKYIIY